VIGSGPAGMTTAVSLAEKGFDVMLVEAGGLHLTAESQAQYAGEVVGDPYYDISFARLRMFGGTSNHWGGYCIPLDSHDFEPHPHFPDTGWPISKSELDPYLEAACNILEIPNDFEEKLVTPSLRKTRFQFSSPPVKFGYKYDEICRSSVRLRILLNSVLTDLSIENRTIKGASIKTADGRELSIRARCFVLCMGGIENSRLLLWINETHKGRLVQDSRTLGRYWMEHPHAVVAEILVESGPDFFDGGKASFALTKRRQFELGVLNVDLLIEEQAYDTTKGLIADVLCYAPALGRRLMDLFGKNLVCGARVRSHWEQEPLFENHVSLDSAKFDDLGIPQAKLHWKKSESDRKTIVKTVNEFARQMADSELGRVRVVNWVADDGPIATQKIMAGWHHMGGTRMSESPDQGIVDRELRVHGIENLYVGGSSVYPSGGYANPTLTIVQLSLRLSDEIQRRLS
ncbi:MAG: GMC family oxidoreductase, partial [Myxococcales bacterium]|nr:GMC family oxidoreductase [Myxococcales bacterium]